MGQLTEKQHEDSYNEAVKIVDETEPRWEELAEFEKARIRKQHYAIAAHLQFDVLTECDPPSEEEFRQVFESCMRTSSRQALIDLFKGRADKNKALAKRIASGFVPRTTCREGHDLAEHGYDSPNGRRCRICTGEQLAGIARKGATARWKDGHAK